MTVSPETGAAPNFRTRWLTRLLGVLSNLCWLLAPLLLWQGHRVRQRIDKLPAPQGPRSGIVSEGEQVLGLLILGDSSALGVGVNDYRSALGYACADLLSKQLTRSVGWQIAAANGRRISQVAATLKALLPERRVDVVVVCVGVNDVTGWTRCNRWRAELSTLCAQLASRFDQPLILFSGLPPVHEFRALPQPLRAVLGLRACVLDRLLRESLATNRVANYVSLQITRTPDALAADGFHPGAIAYREWAQQMAAQNNQRDVTQT